MTDPRPPLEPAVEGLSRSFNPEVLLTPQVSGHPHPSPGRAGRVYGQLYPLRPPLAAPPPEQLPAFRSTRQPPRQCPRRAAVVVTRLVDPVRYAAQKSPPAPPAARRLSTVTEGGKGGWLEDKRGEWDSRQWSLDSLPEDCPRMLPAWTRPLSQPVSQWSRGSADEEECREADGLSTPPAAGSSFCPSPDTVVQL